jgi:hypothetical protein
MDSTDKQKYYRYNPGDGGSWWLKEVPTAPPWFQEELNLLAGFSDRGQPRLRVSWAGTLMHDITEKPRLKYMAVREVITGYYYVKEDGSTGITKSMNLPKDARIPWDFYPIKKRLELGRLLWVIEKHVPADELRRLGRFRNRHAPDGELILRELPPEGVYDHYFWVHTMNREYRDLDEAVLTAIKAMWQYDINTTEAQKALDAIEYEQRKTLLGAQEAHAIYQSL